MSIGKSYINIRHIILWYIKDSTKNVLNIKASIFLKNKNPQKHKNTLTGMDPFFREYEKVGGRSAFFRQKGREGTHFSAERVAPLNYDLRPTMLTTMHLFFGIKKPRCTLVTFDMQYSTSYADTGLQMREHWKVGLFSAKG
jgi:hypothetical protein